MRTETSPDDAVVFVALESVGVHGFTEDHAGYLAMRGILLRLLLRHSDIPAASLFDAARKDLLILSDDIDEQAFNDICAGTAAEPDPQRRQAAQSGMSGLVDHSRPST